MNSAILVAVITAGLSLVGTIITVLAANKTTLAALSEQSKVADEKIQGQINLINQEIVTLSDRVDKHNNLVERMYKLETKVTVLEKMEGGNASHD